MSKNKAQPNPLEGLDSIIDRETSKQKAPRSKKKNRGSLKQTSFQAYPDQLIWLESVCSDARKGDSKPIGKGVVLRSLIDFASEYKLDLAGIQSEEEIGERIREAVIKAEGINNG